MIEYKILFVDEVAADIRRFQRYVRRKDAQRIFHLDVKTPENSLENFMKEIRNEDYDAIITDHKLHEENANISFDGIDLVRAILEERKGFPCFVLTSFDDEAVENGDDVNIVYIKGLMDTDGESKAHATFLSKIENQIKKHRKSIYDAENELQELVKKSTQTSLEPLEENRLLELDVFIEKATYKKSFLPEHLKSRTHLDKLHKMIENTDALLLELQKTANDN